MKNLNRRGHREVVAENGGHALTWHPPHKSKRIKNWVDSKTLHAKRAVA